MASGAINSGGVLWILSVMMAIARLSCCSSFHPQQIILVAAGPIVPEHFKKQRMFGSTQIDSILYIIKSVKERKAGKNGTSWKVLVDELPEIYNLQKFSSSGTSGTFVACHPYMIVMILTYRVNFTTMWQWWGTFWKVQLKQVILPNNPKEFGLWKMNVCFVGALLTETKHWFV